MNRARKKPSGWLNGSQGKNRKGRNEIRTLLETGVLEMTVSADDLSADRAGGDDETRTRDLCRDSVAFATACEARHELPEVESQILSELLGDAPYFQHAYYHKGIEQCFLLLAMVRA